jgi:hypothetical protein
VNPVLHTLALEVAAFCVALRDLAVQVAVPPICRPRPEPVRTFHAGGVTVTAPFEESLAAERWIRHGQGHEMTTDRLTRLLDRRGI